MNEARENGEASNPRNGLSIVIEKDSLTVSRRGVQLFRLKHGQAVEYDLNSEAEVRLANSVLEIQGITAFQFTKVRGRTLLIKKVVLP